MAEGAVGPRLDHAGLSVRDLDAMAAWYIEVFGYERELALRVEPLALDIVMLRHAEHGDRLELLHRPGSERSTTLADPAAAALAQGLGHIAFDVGDLDGTFERAVAAGARPVMTPRPSPEPGIRMGFVADPEGNLIELLDRTHRGPGGVDSSSTAGNTG